MNTRDMRKPSPFLKARDLDNGRGGYACPVVTIDDVRSVDAFNPQTRQREPVWCVAFQGKEKVLILNNTNLDTLEQALGTETDDWRGRQIGLFVRREKVAGRSLDVIRIRMPTEPKPTTNGRSEPPDDHEASE